MDKLGLACGLGNFVPGMEPAVETGRVISGEISFPLFYLQFLIKLLFGSADPESPLCVIHAVMQQAVCGKAHKQAHEQMV